MLDGIAPPCLDNLSQEKDDSKIIKKDLDQFVEEVELVTKPKEEEKIQHDIKQEN